MFKFFKRKKQDKNGKIIIAIAVSVVFIFIFIAWYVGNIDFSKENVFQGENIGKGTEKELQDLKNMNKDILDNVDDIVVEGVDKIGENDYYLGLLDAPVQMIVYSDLDDIFSAEYNSILKKVKEEFGDRVVIAFRHFPLRVNNFSFDAGLAVECAGDQGVFWNMQEKIFEAKIKNNLNVEKLKSIAKELDLDEGGFEKCFSSQKYKQKIELQEMSGRKYGVIGAPATFINGHIYQGSYPLDDFVGSDERHRRGLRNIIKGYIDAADKVD